MMNSLIVGDVGEKPHDREHRRGEREDDPPEHLSRRRTVHPRRFVERVRDRVEEALHEPGVDPERATEVDEDDARAGVEAERREDVADLEDDVVDRDDREERREHLDEEEGHHPHPASPESEPREGIRGEGCEEHGEECRRPRDDERVHVPARVRDVEGLLLRPHLPRVPAEDPPEVLESHVVRDDLGARERGDRIERGRHHVDDREDREPDGEEADEVAPPVVGEDRTAPGGCLRDPGAGHHLGLVERGHRISSSIRVRQNEMAEIPATMKKMKIETAAASPYCAPPPAWKAILYV